MGRGGAGRSGGQQLAGTHGLQIGTTRRRAFMAFSLDAGPAHLLVAISKTKVMAYASMHVKDSNNMHFM